MDAIKAKIDAWYDAHIVAAWYKSYAMWVGVLAGLIQFAPEWIQLLLDNFDIGTGAFSMSDGTKRLLQAVLLFVVLPAAKAFRQHSMEEARIKQDWKRASLSPAQTVDTINRMWADSMRQAPTLEPIPTEERVQAAKDATAALATTAAAGIAPPTP